MNTLPIAVSGSSFQQPEDHQGGCRAAAPVVDVLYDQLAYLVAHADGVCPPGCPDCARLEQVKIWLLLPFRAMPDNGAGVHGVFRTGTRT